MMRGFHNKKVFFVLIIFFIIGIVFSHIFTEKKSEIKLNLSPKDIIINVEKLDKDIDTILSLYDLTRPTNVELVVSDESSIYSTYYKKEGIQGKALYLDVDTEDLFPDSEFSKRYVEIESLMDIWLYIVEREFEFNIIGITYYFSIPEFLNFTIPTEIYMPKDEFLALLEEINGEELSHYEKVTRLTDIYVEKTGYKRRSGHIQVEEGTKTIPNTRGNSSVSR